MVSGIHDFDALLTVYGVCDPFDFVCYETVKCLYEFVDFFLHGRMELCVYVFFQDVFFHSTKVVFSVEFMQRKDCQNGRKTFSQ